MGSQAGAGGFPAEVAAAAEALAGGAVAAAAEIQRYHVALWETESSNHISSL